MQRAKRRPGRPPGKTSDATRSKILSAARTCFALKGFGVATNRDIAEHAEITPAAIYQYFDSKVALYVTTAREAIDEVTAHMRTQGLGEGSAVEALSRIVLSLLTVLEQDPSLAPFLSALPGELRRHAELARHFKPKANDMPEILKELVERAVALGELDAKDAARVIAMFISCMMGLSQFAALLGAEQAGGAATAFAELLKGGLFTRVPARVKAPAARTRRPLHPQRRLTKPGQPERRS